LSYSTGLIDRTEWRQWVIPKKLLEKPIHRWYVFPHSFSSELVHTLAEEWSLGPDDHILDPFVGAGTSILAAKELGIPATGYDLSPFAVFVTAAKIANYSVERLTQVWSRILKHMSPSLWNEPARDYPELVRKALPGKLLGAFDAIDRCIAKASGSKAERDFFRLALLSILPNYSRAVATGGWLKWVPKRNDASTVLSALEERVRLMLEDLRTTRLPWGTLWRVGLADARSLQDAGSSYSAVITSPPYPNRHDYTRVFGVELMFAFLDWEETRQLRYQSFHSHPEARPKRPQVNGYEQPIALTRAIERIRKTLKDQRIPRMLEGYFLDMYLALREMRRVCERGAKIALVLGNVQYGGEQIAVDEITAEIGEQTGLTCERLFVARYRGNSAQQMGKFGRRPSRESVIVFSKT